MNILNELVSVLKNNERYIDNDGNLIKAIIQEDALKNDSKLILSLISNQQLKSTFFVEVDGILVFDKVRFSWVLTNREFLPDNYTRYKNKIGLVDNYSNFIKNRNDVYIDFPNKDCLLVFDSTKEKENRPEVFFNELLNKNDIDVLLEKKVFSDFAFFDSNGKSKDPEKFNHENFVIKGNNLLALHSLLPVYQNRIKFMYWDILYNTGEDIVPYNDSIKHSSWLLMMKNRLEVASKLLSSKGSIAVQCDDNEVHYLKVLMDEIFGRDNKLSMITIKVKAPAGVGQESYLFDVNEYVLVYANDINQVEVNVIKDKSKLQVNTYKQYDQLFVNHGQMELINTLNTNGVGEIKVYKHSDYTINKIPANDRNETYYKDNIDKIFRTTNPQGGLMIKLIPELPNGLVSVDFVPTKGKNAGQLTKIYFINKSLVVNLSDSAIIEDNKIYKLNKMTNLWDDNFFQGISNEGGVTLNAGKKPERILKRLIELNSNPGDIVLDAFFGTGTTGAVAMKLNRKFIGIEQLDSHYEKSITRLNNVINGDTTGISKEVGWLGGGSFSTFELKKLNHTIIDKIQQSTIENIDVIYNEIINSPFLVYKTNKKIIKENEDEFNKLSFDEKKRVLFEMLDKNLLYVNFSDMNDDSMGVTTEEKAFTYRFYGVK